MRLPALILLLLLVCAASPALPADHFVPGDYLEDGFLTTLRTTRSPWASGRHGLEQGYPQGITIKRNGDDVGFYANFNWHEGGSVFSVTAGGAIGPMELTDYGGFDPRSLLQVDRPGHVRIAFGTRRLGYTRVGAIGSMDQFVTVMAIGGRYRDARGNLVVFDV